MLVALMSAALPAEELNVLLVGDVHDDVAAVRATRDDLRCRGLDASIDLVLCTGDLTTWKPGEPEAPYAGPASAALRELELVKAPLRWVPGNHEPLCFFNASGGGLCGGEANLHGRAARVARGLTVVGWGGSTAALQDGRAVWAGWPWADEVAIGRGLRQAVRSVLRERDDILLLLHSGPARSSTSSVTGVDPNDLDVPGAREHPIESGSTAVRELLLAPEVQGRAVAAVHGHTHAGVGSTHLGATRVVNPGSLRFGRSYAMLRFVRSGRRWRLLGVEHHTLGHCAAPTDGGHDQLVRGATVLLLLLVAIWLWLGRSRLALIPPRDDEPASPPSTDEETWRCSPQAAPPSGRPLRLGTLARTPSPGDLAACTQLSAQLSPRDAASARASSG